MSNTAQTLLNQGTTLGYDALSDRDLKECLLAVATPGVPPNSNAQTLETLAASMKYPALSQRSLWVALAGFYANSGAPITATTAMATAAANHYDALSDLQLDESLLVILT